jgi:hypothetical protein
MSSLAFDKQGKPFAWHKRIAKLRVRLFRNPSARGTCCQVLDGVSHRSTHVIVIGNVGAPAPDAFRRLHCDLWERDRSRCFVPVDPRPHLVGWKLLEHHDAFTPAPPSARAEAA